MSRVAIFVFWDENNEIKEYVTYFLKGLSTVTDRIITVVNGELTDDATAQLESLSSKLIFRENIGFDIWAYKTGIEYLEGKDLNTIDELILCNATCYGPIYPFSEMFDAMSDKTCDFWGVVKHPEQPNYLLPNKQGYIFEHIMSFFTIIRHRMLTSKAFKDYWHSLPMFTEKKEAVGLHETQFTKRFEGLGYVSDAYVDLAGYKGRCYNSSIILANELLTQDRCPLVKRRAFMFPFYGNLLDISSADQTIELLDFIKNKTDYDIGMIWHDLFRTQKMSVLKNNMHLTRVLPDASPADRKRISGKMLSAVIYFPKDFYVQIAKPYILSMPTDAKLYVAAADEHISALCQEAFEDTPHNITFAIISEEDTCELHKLCLQAAQESDYICCILNIGAVKDKLRVGEEDYCRYIFSSMMHSEGYVDNIVAAFETDPFMGAAMPIKANFALYFSYKEAYDAPRNSLYKTAFTVCGLDVPYDDGVYSNTNSALWLRKDAAETVFAKLSDTETVETLVRYEAVDRVIPAIIQSCNYYVMSVADTVSAAVSLDNQHYMQQRILNAHVLRTWRFSQLINNIRGPATKAMSRTEIMKMAFGFRDLLLLLIRYPKNKLKDIRRKRNARRFPSINASLTAINTEGNRLNLFFCSGTDQLKNWHVSLDGKNFYPKHDVSFGQKLVTNYHKDFCALTDAFIDIPLDAVKNKKLRLFNGQEPVSFRWTSQVSYNALEMREKGLFCRIDRGVLYIQTRARFFWSAMFSRFYGVRDKLVLLFLALNPFHPITIMAENMGAADNAFQLFTYALDKGEQVYFVVSDKVRDSQRDSRIKKRMLVHNSYRHHLAMMFSGRWISSFSLRAELFPTRQGLKDIHYCFIPAEWIFVPHGMAVGDKLTGLFHRYNWDNPGRTFVSTKAERDAFSNIFDFKNVAAFGAPRMDKWYGAELDENEIFIYFTWRLSLSKANDSSCVAFTSTTYYKTIVYAVTSVRRAFPAKHIEFAFHHEVVKQGYDEAIKQALDGLSIKFIYLNDAKGTEEFNGCFRSAKYLVTDISSVAFDFAYKEGAIPVYYQPEGFLNGHYEVEPVFYDIQLGVITRNVEELCTALSINTPTVEMAERRKTFYQYLDGNNTARVYEAIFKDRKKTSHTVVAKELPPRRLAIYLFYDADGIVDDYIPYCLTQLQTVCSQIWVVVNGNLTDEGRRKLESNCDRLVVRENIGFDSWGYKQAIETIGFDSLKNDFDELILTNYTYYGPIYPFIDMFAAMSERECDFWSHSRYSGHGNLLMDTGVRVDDHLQSYFLVFRKDILRSGTFRKYWDTLLLPTRYSDAVAYHELRCLKYFEQKGFISDSFIPSQKYKKCPANPPVFCAYSQLTEDKSPILKRKIFYVKDSEFEFPQKEPHTPYEIIKFIRGNTDYDIGLILENLERTVLIDERKKDSANEVTNKDMKSKRMGMERKNATYSESDFIRLFERTSNAEED